MVLIDTAGMAQRDTRTGTAGHAVAPLGQPLLVVNAAAQGETIEDVLSAYRAARPAAAWCCPSSTKPSSSARRWTR
jgi:flagellar biosynthesis GTPase FlhF